MVNAFVDVMSVFVLDRVELYTTLRRHHTPTHWVHKERDHVNCPCGGVCGTITNLIASASVDELIAL